MTGLSLADFRNLPRRAGRLANLADLALRLNVSPLKVFDPRWRAAIDIVRFSLLPLQVRANLRTLCDVGANRGDWTAAMLTLAQPELIVALEPIPQVFADLSARFAGQSHVRCVQAAVGSSTGVIALNVENQTELSSIRPLSNKGRKMHGASTSRESISVPLVTLDDELASLDEISLVKLDVQGYENEVICGARRVLGRCRCLVTEVLYDRDYYTGALPFLELARLIEEISPLRLSCVSEPALAPDGMGSWADAIFVKPL
jgi:FkbM family methyltransferase